ncbi:MAG: TrkA family potassium uptake protein [Spirochaetes bacterium]|nr:TrkA family potassium uptake protein [Spirochaetota bacterium]MBU0955876.1 TrkA family potassium uptake protein [Spirochaetota bacterium]
MKQFAILGLSYFGKNVLEEMLDLDIDILIVDKDRELIDLYKDQPLSAVVADISSEEILRKILPKNLDGVVIDMGDKVESSILVTSYCRKLGIPRIFVKAVTDGHAEILNLVGATNVVFPNREAAKRVTPLLVSSGMLNYLPVSGNLVIAEVEVPDNLFGVSLLKANIRKSQGVNLISIKSGEDEEYGMVDPEYIFQPGDIALVSGSDEAIENFAQLKGKRGRHGLKFSDIGKLFRKAGSRVKT